MYFYIAVNEMINKLQQQFYNNCLKPQPHSLKKENEKIIIYKIFDRGI